MSKVMMTVRINHIKFYITLKNVQALWKNALQFLAIAFFQYYFITKAI
jgi:hypothetical protein